VRITINDVAKLSNVSKSTISRVINRSGPVSTQTREKVMQAVDALNYQPNEIARSLSLKRTKTIGVLVQDIRNPYYAESCWHAERVFKKYDYKIIISNADNNREDEATMLDGMRFHNVDGILCVGIQEESSRIVSFLSKTDIPVVVVDREIKGFDVKKVVLDNEYGGQLVADYLVSLGHRNIAFVTSQFTQAERCRLDGFKKAFAVRNLPLLPEYIITQSEEMWHKGECPELVKLMKSGPVPTAIFASNDFKAFHVVNILKKSNILVPDDVSLVGYDDVDAASYVSPSLTTVHQPVDKVIDRGAEMLMKLINNEEIEEIETVLRPWLVERESTRKID
jgi:DNA-binding LacI/PurR family transcriptional regulator